MDEGTPAGEGAHADLEALDTFTKQITPPKAGALTGARSAPCGGGIPECRTLVNAETAALEAARQFLLVVAQGIGDYRQAVSASRDDYLNRDLSSADQITRARDHVSWN